MTISTSNPNSEHLVELAKSAPFYQAYQDAFRLATGLPLVLIPANARGFNACHGSANQNGFPYVEITQPLIAQRSATHHAQDIGEQDVEQQNSQHRGD